MDNDKQSGKPNPRMSDVVAAKKLMERQISETVSKSMAEFQQLTGMFVVRVEVKLATHKTFGVLDDAVVLGVETHLELP